MKRVGTVLACLLVLIVGCTAASHIKQLQPPAVPKSPPITLPSTQPPVLAGTFLRGVAVDFYTYPGQDISVAAETTVSFVRGLHANAMSISFPIFLDGSGVQTTRATPTPGQLAVLVNDAENAGMRVTIRPLLDESSFHHCRCTLAVQPAWFASYRRLLIPYARMANANHVATFVVGVEFTRFAHASQWRKINRAVRTVYHGTLACSDNWSVDTNGCLVQAQTVDAYHPILGNLFSGWKAYDRSFPRGAVLSEIGIDAVPAAVLMPWRHHWPVQGLDPTVQARWFTAACHAAIATHLSGIYYWPLGFGNPRVGPTLTYQGLWGGGAGASAIRRCFQWIERTGK
jgi:hypothetical protein